MTEPLTGVRVVTLATNLPGPLAAARLAELGAEVTKIEPPAGDALASFHPKWYAALAAGQDVRVLDLKSAPGRSELLELLAGADLLLTASRPAALARLELDWPALATRFPRLCQVAIVGHAGKDGDRPGHDLTYQAEAGLLDGAAMPRSPFADLAGAERAVSEACAVLVQRDRQGRGAYREVSLAVVAADLAEPLRRGLTTPDGPLGGGIPTYRSYVARDGQVAVACLEPHFRDRLIAELEVDGSQAGFEKIFTTKTAAQWEQWAATRDLPVVRVHTGIEKGEHTS